MLLREIILSLLIQNTPAGDTVYSLELLPECGKNPLSAVCDTSPVNPSGNVGCDPENDPLCAPPRWSTFYGAWVRYETKSAAHERYGLMAAGMAEAALELLCLDRFGDIVEDCKPIRWGYSYKTKKNHGTLRSLVLSGLASLIPESGAREDVQVGRGRYKKPVDGGEGRGPGNEACPMQVLPTMAYKFGRWLSPEEREEAKKSRAARERIVQQMLGRSPDAARRCALVGLSMLARSRTVCGRRAAEWYAQKKLPVKADGVYWWAFGMYSYYGVGPGGNAGGCYDVNKGKTLLRVRLLQKLLAKAPEVTFETKAVAQADRAPLAGDAKAE